MYCKNISGLPLAPVLPGQLPLAHRLLQVLQKTFQTFAFGLIEVVIQVLCKIIVERKDRIWVFRHHGINLGDALPVSLIKRRDEVRIDRFVADPGSEHKRQTGKGFPGAGQIIDMRGNLSLFQRAVANDDTGGGPFYMIAKIFSSVDEPGADLPVFLQQDPCQLYRCAALIVK